MQVIDVQLCIYLLIFGWVVMIVYELQIKNLYILSWIFESFFYYCGLKMRNTISFSCL